MRRPTELADRATSDLHDDVTAHHRLPTDQPLATARQPDQVTGAESGQVDRLEDIDGGVDLPTAVSMGIECMFE